MAQENRRLVDRAAAYRATFIANRAKVPETTGGVTPAAAVVLRDLAHYCYVYKPTLKVSQVTQQCDPLAMAFAEGRRDVFNRIMGLCNLTHEQIDRITRGNGNDN